MFYNVATDFHLTGAFRQPLGIPNNILPDIWRNIKKEGDEKSCFVEDPSCIAKEHLRKFSDPCQIHDDLDEEDDYDDLDDEEDFATST